MDSIEEYCSKIGDKPEIVENLRHFHEQLLEALTIAQVTPMDKPSGEFIAKTQRAVGVETVDAAQNGQIVRVVRGGWLLNGQILRPSDVVVGKSK